MRFPIQLALVLAVVAVAAGCGGKKASPTVSTSTTSVAANTAYERSYTDCASTKPIDLAHRYNVKNNREAIATAVAKYWANRAGGGADAVALGREGCKDGFAVFGH